ncbi:hypothetical protein U9M48_011491 [Paspalum notatum var. saurae]|uniref:Rx N-terminal domain-containing protein n=1 Tax=Paspalum notatum var. saurae TaxID=547442 RepID=A0AAQ3SVI9_PASNO
MEDKRLQKMQQLLLRAQTIIEEAEGRLITNRAMVYQLSIMRKEMYRGYFTLDSMRIQAREAKDHDDVSHSFALSKFKHAKRLFSSYDGMIRNNDELQKVIHNLSNIVDDAKELVVFLKNYPPLYRQPYSMHLFVGECMFGRQMEVDRVMGFLMQDEHPSMRGVGVLPIVGPGYVGKSTLVAHVCYDVRVRNQFSRIVVLHGDEISGDPLASLNHGGSLIYQNNDLGEKKRVLAIIEFSENADKLAWNNIYSSFSDFFVLTFGSADSNEHPKLESVAMELAREMGGSFIAANIISSILRKKLSAQYWGWCLTAFKENIQRNVSMFGEHPYDLLQKQKCACYRIKEDEYMHMTDVEWPIGCLILPVASCVIKRRRPSNTSYVAAFFSREAWSLLFRLYGLLDFSPFPDDREFGVWWLRISDLAPRVLRKGLNSLITLTDWTLWKHRNNVVFKIQPNYETGTITELTFGGNRPFLHPEEAELVTQLTGDDGAGPASLQCEDLTETVHLASKALEVSLAFTMAAFFKALLGEKVFLLDNDSKVMAPTMEDKKLHNLERLLLWVHVIIEEAEGRYITNQAMVHQLNVLRKEMYRGYFIMGNLKRQGTETNNYKGNDVSNSFIFSKFNSVKRLFLPNVDIHRETDLQQVIDNLSNIMEDVNGIVVFLNNYPPLYRQPYSMHLFIEKCMFGRQMEMERIMAFLMQKEDQGTGSVGILPIVGPSFVGKSTLVAHVCNDARVRNYFCQSILITVHDINNENISTLKDGAVIMHQNNALEQNERLLAIIELSGDIDVVAWNTYWYFFKIGIFGSIDSNDHPELESIAMEIARGMNGSFVGANVTFSFLKNNLVDQCWQRYLACPVEENVPMITMKDIICERGNYEGEFDVLAWKSHIPPYNSYIFKCVIEKVKIRKGLPTIKFS